MKDFRLFSLATRFFGLTIIAFCVGLLVVIPASFAATYTVTTLTDEADDGECVADTTLREAITCANTSAGSDSIVFGLSGTSTLGSILPSITEAVDIDGNGGIVLSGTTSGAMDVQATNVTVRGFSFFEFSSCAINLSNGGSDTIGGTDPTDRNVFTSSLANSTGICIQTSNNIVINNYIGIQSDGATAGPLNIGITISTSGSGNVIGGDEASERNVISGNTTYGIRFSTGATGTVMGNYIGTNASGTAAVSNATGISIANSTYSNAIVIGGDTAGERNIISGNLANGIDMGGTYQNIKIIGNYIGTDVNGTSALPNSDGINFNAATCSALGNCWIGGTGSGEGNVISGNTEVGIDLANGGGTNWQITANYIGTTASGATALGNTTGIRISGSGTSIVIGKNDTSATNYNVISGNTNYGIHFQDFSGSITISSNYIGVNAAGTAAVANGEDGIYVQNFSGAGSVTIGSSTATSPTNVISGNSSRGIWLTSSTDGSTMSVYSTILGLSASQDAAIANSSSGIVRGGTAGTVVIGNTLTSGFNVIAGNGENGISTSSGISDTIIGNYIGVNSGLTSVFTNGESGVYVSGGAPTIGGTDSGEGNIITGHTTAGKAQIYITSGASGVQILGNYIGIDTDGNALGSGLDGIYNEGTSTAIGSTTSGGRNYIGNMTDSGIELAGGSGTIIRNNYIGVKPDGSSSIGNGGSGILIVGSSGNTIGYGFVDTIADEGMNIIKFNTTAQIKLDGTGTANFNTIRGNYLGTTNPTVFANSPNSGVSLTGTSSSVSNTSRFAVTTDFADGSKMDVYSVTGAGVVTYEGTATVSGGVAQLDMDFTAVAGDNYFFQITEADDDSTVLSGNFLAVADSTAPSAPTVTSSTNITNVAAYTFTGTKEAYSSIWNGGIQQVAVDSSATWTYVVTLSEGANSFSFTSKDYSSNESTATAVSITLDTIAPSASTITSATSYSGSASTYSATITGTKEANALVKNNGIEVVAADALTTWSYAVTLSSGTNSYSFTVVDTAGNTSSATAHTITYTQLAGDTPGAVGGGSGSGGYQSNHYSDTLVEEEEAEEIETDGTEEEIANAGEEEDAEEGIAEAGEEDISFENETMEVLNSADNVSSDQFETEASMEESLMEIDVSSFEEQVEILYPASDVYVSQPVSFGEEIQFEETVVAEEMVLPETSITREYIFVQPILEEEMGEVEADDDSDTVPDWWELANFNTTFVSESADSDQDGVMDTQEFLMGTNPGSADSDADGVLDGDEITGGLDANHWDSDGDGLSDDREIGLGTDPLVADSDGDGMSDNIEVNADSDPLDVKSAPVSTVIGGVSVPNQWLEENGLDTIVYGADEFIFELNVNVERTLNGSDTDKDGLSDADELKYGTNPREVDSDGDGVFDGAEVHVYQTDPMTMTRSGQLFQTRISSLKSNVRNIYMDGRPVIAGTSKPDTQVQISFVLLKGSAVASGAQDSFLKRLSHFLLANLFEEVENPGDTMTFETETGTNGKFLAQPDTELPAGRYAVVVRSLDVDGNITSETLPYDLTIDPAAAMSLVDPKQLDTQLIDVTKLEVLKIQNSQPYLYGVAENGYEVVTSWKSELFTSSLVVDTTRGEFVTASPSQLEQGDHNVFVYAVEPGKNLYSSVINVGFQVVGAGALYSSAEEGSRGFTMMAFGLGGVLLILGLVFVAYKKKHKMCKGLRLSNS